MKQDEKYVVLKAIHKNWGLSKAGLWLSTEWELYSTHSYRVVYEWMPTLDDLIRISPNGEPDPTRRIRKIYTGHIGEARYDSILAYQNMEWPQSDLSSCDGSIWSFIFYDQNGEIVNSIDGFTCIYGKLVFEGLSDLLPRNEWKCHNYPKDHMPL